MHTQPTLLILHTTSVLSTLALLTQLSLMSLTHIFSLSFILSLFLFLPTSLPLSPIHQHAHSIVETTWKWKHYKGDRVQGLDIQRRITTTTILCWSSYQHSAHTKRGEGFTDEISPQGNSRSTQSTIHP